jgi:small-conductance mechanosensitive channel
MMLHAIRPGGGNLAVRTIKSLSAACLLAILAVVFGALPGGCSETPSESELSTVKPAAGYPVMVDGYIVFYVHESMASATAEQRAQKISERIVSLAGDAGADLNNLKTSDETYGTVIKLGDQIVVLITDDEARDAGLPRQALAIQYVGVIRDAMQRARQERSRRYLVRAAIYAAVTLALYVLLFWAILWVFREAIRRLKKSTHLHIKSLKIQQSEIVGAERLSEALFWIVHTARWVLLTVLTYFFLATIFSYFPWTRGQSQSLLGYVVSPLRTVGNSMLRYIPNLFYIAVILIVTRYVLHFVRLVAEEVQRGRIRIPGFYTEWTQPTYKIVRFLIFAFTAVIIVPYLPGEESPAFKGIGVFLGVLVSLGSTSAVSNVVAGIILTYTRGFRVGDWVTIGDNTGEVTQQALLATHIKTPKNVEITIPNSVVLGSHVQNFSMMAHGEGVILHTSVTIGYDAPWRTIHELLINAARKTEFVLEQPPPFVLQNALDDSYVEYQINAYTRSPHEMVKIYSDLHANIQDSFYEAGVEIMSPIFHALRDGNRVAIPDQFLPKAYRAPGFRVSRAVANPDSGKSHS